MRSISGSLNRISRTRPRDSDIDYGAEPDDQAPMIADDADVSVISAHPRAPGP